MAASPLVSRREAMKNPTSHQFIKGLGYLAHTEPPEIPLGTRPSTGCTPPTGTPDGSLHLLQPPGTRPKMTFKWLMRDSAWQAIPIRGNRIAWTADHMKRAGWSYAGPAD